MKEKVIFLVDMQSFYASVEKAENPHLKNRPVIVSGDPEKRGGVVLAACPLAKQKGVVNASRLWEAQEKCPEAVVLRPRMQRYIDVSLQITAILEEYTDLVEPYSIDEQFMDITGSQKLFGTPMEIAKSIQGRIMREIGVYARVGLNEQGKLDVRRAVGTNGTLSVVKDLGLREFFTGQVEIVSGELGDDFTYYLVSSEQVPSSVGVGVLVNPDNTILAAGGFIIQLMPGTDDETITKIEQRLSQVEPISKLIQKGLTPEEILEEVLGEKPEILETMPVRFHCPCSKERFETAILGLGKKEIQDMIEEDGQAEAVCHFCNEKYLFTKEELEGLRDQTTR